MIDTDKREALNKVGPPRRYWMSKNSSAEVKKAVNVKSFQILAHLMFKEHPFWEIKDGWIVMAPATRFCAMMRTVPRDLRVRLTYLKKKGFIEDFESKTGEIKVKLAEPKNWTAVHDFVPSVDIDRELEVAVLEEYGKTKFNPHTLEFE